MSKLSNMKPLIKRIGGKSKLKKTIVDNYFPNNYKDMIYVEPFVGGGSIYFYKQPSYVDVLNDRDNDVITIFKGFQEFDLEKIEKDINGNYTKDDFLRIKESTPITSYDKFIRLLLLIKLSFWGLGRNFINKGDRSVKINSSYNNRYKQKLSNTILLNDDYKDIIKRYDSDNTLFYLDPPYDMVDKTYYKFFIFDIKELFDILKNIKGKFILSFNLNKDIEVLFKDYNIYKVNTKYSAHTGEAPVKKQELLITNF